MMSTLTTPCQWEDETVRERTGHPPSYAEDKEMKSLILHTHGCPRASLRDCSFSSSSSSPLKKLCLMRASVEVSCCVSRTRASVILYSASIVFIFLCYDIVCSCHMCEFWLPICLPCSSSTRDEDKDLTPKDKDLTPKDQSKDLIPKDKEKDLTPKDQDKDLTPKDQDKNKDLLDLTPQGQGQEPGQGQGLEICP